MSAIRPRRSENVENMRGISSNRNPGLYNRGDCVTHGMRFFLATSADRKSSVARLDQNQPANRYTNLMDSYTLWPPSKNKKVASERATHVKTFIYIATRLRKMRQKKKPTLKTGIFPFEYSRP